MFWTLGLLIFGSVLLAVSPSWAYPTPHLPEVSLGSLPNKSFSGTLAHLTSTEVFLVPDGQEFIITAFVASYTGAGGFSGSNGVELQADGVRVLGGKLIGESVSSVFALNKAHLKIASGQALSVLFTGPGSTSEATYFFQGHLVEEGSPYRSFWGTLSEPAMDPGPYTIFTAEDERPFIVRTLAFYCSSGGPDVTIDGSVALPRTVYATSMEIPPKLFAAGEGNLVVPQGSALGLKAFPGAGGVCEYYFDGEYVNP